MGNASMTQLICMEKWWTNKTSPDFVRGSFNTELLRKIIEHKINDNKSK